MTPPGSGHDERVVVIEHDAFRDLWSTELDGGLVVEREDVERIEPGAVTVLADEGKRRFDIAIPQLTRALARSDTALDRLDPSDVADPREPLEVPEVAPDEYIHYRGLHLIDKAEIERDRFFVPYAEDPAGVISYYTKAVARAGGVERIAGAFAFADEGVGAVCARLPPTDAGNSSRSPWSSAATGQNPLTYCIRTPTTAPNSKPARRTGLRVRAQRERASPRFDSAASAEPLRMEPRREAAALSPELRAR